MKSVPLFMIQLHKIKRSTTGVFSMGFDLGFLHLAAITLAFQSAKSDVLELS